MRLNHLDLHLPTIKETRDLFIEIFGFRLISSPRSEVIAILEDESGFVLVLQKQKSAKEHYPDGFHVGFYVDDHATVDDLQSKFRTRGYETSEIISNARGYMFYVRIEAGVMIEVNSRPT